MSATLRKIEYLKRLMTIKSLVNSNPYPALNNLDRKLKKYICKKNGFFIECGANNGYTQSNTFHYEYCMNWTGVLIEAIPELARQCEYLRINSKVYNCALVSNSFSSENITMRYAGLMSLVKDSKGKDEEDAWIDRGSMRENIQNPYEIDVPVRTLTSILDEMKPGSIDLFSLDVEGYELEVLKGLDLDKYCPDYILIELHDKDAVCSHLGAEYEMCEELTPNWDYLFRRKGL